MTSWRDKLLEQFIPGIARLTLVADPDGLLLEERMLEVLRERGFEVVALEDHVAFRYVYESKFRSRWDQIGRTDASGEDVTSGPELVVVVKAEPSDLNTLPYDLIETSRKLSLSLGDLFPNLSYPVVAELDRGDLDALFDAEAKYAPGRLGDNATKDFILRHVFEIAPELIKEPKDLLRVLLRRHYTGRRLPRVLDEWLVQVLRQDGLFDDWPLETIVPDREAFLAFLQERWPLFLDILAGPGVEAPPVPISGERLRFPGPAVLPFGHDDVRIYIDNLFAEGLLKPVVHDQAEALASTWAACGVVLSMTENRKRRLETLLGVVDEAVPAHEARHEEWLRFAHQWAELAALQLEADAAGVSAQYQERMRTLTSRVDESFAAWLRKRYASLISLPPAPPVMVHHLPRYLARIVGGNGRTKVAYLVVDGLALQQWIVLREVLKEQDETLEFREAAVFAWIPTLTSVSRQAALAGIPPTYFQSTIHTTDGERDHWTRFWLDEGLSKDQVAYAKGLGDLAGNLSAELPPGVEELLSQPKLQAVALVIDKVDRIMHGMELGAVGMQSQVGQWARQGFLCKLIALLHELGFQVFLTSDHGNVEAEGMGSLREGAIAELRGERVRIYPDNRLRAQAQERFPEAWAWPLLGLPESYVALLAPDRNAFVQKGKRIVTHGGATLEEVIVPWIEIGRRS